jgi:hypothetical protein
MQLRPELDCQDHSSVCSSPFPPARCTGTSHTQWNFLRWVSVRWTVRLAHRACARMLVALTCSLARDAPKFSLPQSLRLCRPEPLRVSSASWAHLMHHRGAPLAPQCSTNCKHSLRLCMTRAMVHPCRLCHEVVHFRCVDERIAVLQ